MATSKSSARPPQRSAAVIRRELEALRRESRELVLRMEDVLRHLHGPARKAGRKKPAAKKKPGKPATRRRSS